MRTVLHRVPRRFFPSLKALGKSRREVRGRLAALRELGCDIYEAESGMHISWVAHTPVASEGKQLKRVA